MHRWGGLGKIIYIYIPVYIYIKSDAGADSGGSNVFNWVANRNIYWGRGILCGVGNILDLVDEAIRSRDHQGFFFVVAVLCVPCFAIGNFNL